MSRFPGSPKVMKAAIIGLDPANPPMNVNVFENNPETILPRRGRQDRI
jgi:hypothetical protein